MNLSVELAEESVRMLRPGIGHACPILVVSLKMFGASEHKQSSKSSKVIAEQYELLVSLGAPEHD